MGYLFWVKIAPNPWPEASASMTKGMEKLGMAGTSAVYMVDFRASKAVMASQFYLKLFFLSCWVKGVARIAQFHIKRL